MSAKAVERLVEEAVSLHRQHLDYWQEAGAGLGKAARGESNHREQGELFRDLKVRTGEESHPESYCRSATWR